MLTVTPRVAPVLGLSKVRDQKGISRLYNMLEICHSGTEPYHADTPRVPDQKGISGLYNMLEICHSGPEPSPSCAPFPAAGFRPSVAPFTLPPLGSGG